EKILKDKLLSKFTKDNPEGYSEKTINKLLAQLKNDNIKIRPVFAKFLLKREYSLSQKQPIFDREFDPQLNKAIEILSSEN
ncbi:MAG: peptidase S41, partial [Leptospiraceae bacterium]|nr:peptidase S41 [Leptospiraceae bacterium]